MRTILFLIATAGIAHAAPGDWDLEKAASMMVDRESCQIQYDQSDLRDHLLIKGSMARGVSATDGAGCSNTGRN